VRIVIAGGGGAGMIASLLLARAGHEIVVPEQDRLAPTADVEAAAEAAFRPSAPQIVQSHIIMPGCRELFRRLLPDVYRGLIAAGAVNASRTALMPASLRDRSAWPGDERLGVMLTRRSTVDWVLMRAVRAEPGVRIRCGERVTGLFATADDPPRAIGVCTARGEVPADMVIDATGRRSPLDRWLAEIGARPTDTRRDECGLAYFTRHYRLRPGAEFPGPRAIAMVVRLDEFTAVIAGGDNGTMQLAVVPLAADHRFRMVRRAEVFSAVLRTVPAIAPWLDALDPISEIFPMAGLHNVLRRLVADGAPVVTGLQVIGDSVCTTNPTFGRGLGLALAGAADLAAVIGQHPADRRRGRGRLTRRSSSTSRPSTRIRRPPTASGWRCSATPSSAPRHRTARPPFPVKSP
jgi:2-polyprenyl-6-methoxyphenol hydroxylase-like FAD-dependent oxidoreductase